jgi:hypothetical protein
VTTDQPKAYDERLDPGGETRRQMQGMASLATGPWAWLLRAAGVDSDVLEEAKRLSAEGIRSLTGLNERASLLSSIGWPLFELSIADEYNAAAALVADGRPEEAEALLVQAWNGDTGLTFLKMAVHRVWTLYDVEGPEFEIARERALLIDEALSLHKEGRYAAVIPIVLSQMDGIANDMSARSFFTRRDGRSAAQVTDDTTLAGHPETLLALSQMMTEGCPTTETSGRLLRHGILHGRELGYGTRENSTKAFAALLALIVWAQPVARERLDRFGTEREDLHTGSRESDEEGKWLDRRGFEDAQTHLQHTIRGMQMSIYRRAGRYATTRDEIDPSGLVLKDLSEFELQTSPAGDEFWAWIVTPSGYVLGIASRAGEWPSWYYAGEEPPRGGVDSDPAWRHEASDDWPPDWT